MEEEKKCPDANTGGILLEDWMKKEAKERSGAIPPLPMRYVENDFKLS